MSNGLKSAVLLLRRKWFDTHWVGGERPALPQTAHCLLRTMELDRPIPSPAGWRTGDGFRIDREWRFFMLHIYKI